MKNYEKGEWRLNNYHHPYQYIVAHGGPEDSDAFPGQRKICDICDWNTERGRTNAHLIVSAPILKQQRDALLAACMELIENEPFGITPYFDKALRKVEAAIAKAKA